MIQRAGLVGHVIRIVVIMRGGRIRLLLILTVIKIKNPAYEDFAKKWGDVDLENPTNPSLPKLVKPKDSNGEVFNDKPF